MPDSLTEPLLRAIERTMVEMRVSLPARVEQYDETKQRADVKPLLNRRYADGEEAELPVIAGVPLVWPRAGGAAMTMPVAKGDGVLLVFADRSIDRWLADGGQVTPDDPRTHDLSDAVAIPGLVPFADLGTAGPTPDSSAVVIWHGDTVMRLYDDGTVEVDGDTAITGNLTVDGNVEATGDVQAGGDVVADSQGTAISLLEHTHIGNLGSSTSPPEP